MKVRDLIRAVQYGKKNYGKDFLDYDVYVEQLSHSEKSGGRYMLLKDCEGWDYVRCDGFNTYMPKEKVFTVNVNF